MKRLIGLGIALLLAAVVGIVLVQQQGTGITGAAVVKQPAVASPSAVKPTEIIIGAIFPLSGDAQRIGSMKKDGAELAVEEINADGGINGAKLAVIYEDSQAKAQTGISAFRKLVDVDRVPVIMSAMSGWSGRSGH
jgi:branched-chain amino acid transport system substrate-binding protein